MKKLLISIVLLVLPFAVNAQAESSVELHDVIISSSSDLVDAQTPTIDISSYITSTFTVETATIETATVTIKVGDVTGIVVLKNAIPIMVYDLTDQDWKYGIISDLYVPKAFPYLTLTFGAVKDITDSRSSASIGAAYKAGAHLMSTPVGSKIREIIPTVISDGGLNNFVIGYSAFYFTDDSKLHHSVFSGLNIPL